MVEMDVDDIEQDDDDVPESVKREQQEQHIWEQRKRWSLTKSKFVDFLKCPKMAYWKHWHPDGGVLEDGVQDEMDFGTKVHKAYEAISGFISIQEDMSLTLDEDQFDHYVDKLNVERVEEFREAVEHLIEWHDTIARNVQQMPDEKLMLASWQDYAFPRTQEIRVHNDDDELYGYIDGVYEYPTGGVALVDIKHGKYDDHMKELMFYKHAYEGREAGEKENGNVCNATIIFYTDQPVEPGTNPEILDGDELEQQFDSYLDTFEEVKGRVDDWNFTCPHGEDCDHVEYHRKVENEGGVMSREAIAEKRDRDG